MVAERNPISASRGGRRARVSREPHIVARKPKPEDAMKQITPTPTSELYSILNTARLKRVYPARGVLEFLGQTIIPSLEEIEQSAPLPNNMTSEPHNFFMAARVEGKKGEVIRILFPDERTPGVNINMLLHVKTGRVAVAYSPWADEWEHSFQEKYVTSYIVRPGRTSDFALFGQHLEKEVQRWIDKEYQAMRTLSLPEERYKRVKELLPYLLSAQKKLQEFNLHVLANIDRKAYRSEKQASRIDPLDQILQKVKELNANNSL